MDKDWQADLECWLTPFIAALGHKTRARMCPAYVAGLIGPGDRKSIQPMAARDSGVSYDQLHHFIGNGVWDSAPLEAALLSEADKLVGGDDAWLIIDDTALPKKGRHSVGVAPQYASSLGKTATCQSLVSVTLARREVPVTLGLRLFLPESWTSDPERMAQARVLDMDRADAAEWLGARTGLLVFGMAVVLVALVLTVVWVKDTLPWAKAETAAHRAAPPKSLPRYPVCVSEHPATGEVFALMSWRDRRLFAISQAGLVEKFVDALVWALFPVFLVSRGASLTEVGWIVGVYGFVWGGSQLFTGRLSDHVGRFWPNVLGMWICGAGVALVVLGSGALWWSVSAGVAGFGMALLYPNLSAAVADITPPSWRGSAIGVYRFWRDLGYAIGALGLGLAASLTGAAEAAFWFVAISMLVSGATLFWLGEETHPRLNPAEQPKTARS